MKILLFLSAVEKLYLYQQFIALHFLVLSQRRLLKTDQWILHHFPTLLVISDSPDLEMGHFSPPSIY